MSGRKKIFKSNKEIQVPISSIQRGRGLLLQLLTEQYVERKYIWETNLDKFNFDVTRSR